MASKDRGLSKADPACFDLYERHRLATQVLNFLLRLSSLPCCQYSPTASSPRVQYLFTPNRIAEKCFFLIAVIWKPYFTLLPEFSGPFSTKRLALLFGILRTAGFFHAVLSPHTILFLLFCAPDRVDQGHPVGRD